MLPRLATPTLQQARSWQGRAQRRDSAALDSVRIGWASRASHTDPMLGAARTYVTITISLPAFVGVRIGGPWRERV